MDNQARNHLNLQKHIADQDHIIRVRNAEIAALRKRAEKAEKERDQNGALLSLARDALAATERQRDEAQREAKRHYLRAENHRPLTADAITDAMIERAHDYWERNSIFSRDGMRGLLAAALTEPAEDPEVVALAEVLGDFAVADEHNGTRDDMQLARLLHGRGVRVVSEEDPR